MLAIFAAAPELGALIQGVEGDYARYRAHPKRRPEGPHAELLPWLAEQAQDWEAAASAGVSGGPAHAGGATARAVPYFLPLCGVPRHPRGGPEGLPWGSSSNMF